MKNTADPMTSGGIKMVLMTTPSLDPNVNVSGISAVVRGLMTVSGRHDSPLGWQLVPAMAGKRDRQRRGLGWVLSQVLVPLRFGREIWQIRPTLVHVNGPLSRFAVLRDATLIGVARLFAVPVVYHLHGGAFMHISPASGMLMRIIKWSLRKASVILVLSDLESASVMSVYGVAPGRIRVLRNAVNVPADYPAKAAQGRLRVLSIGRLSAEKGLSVLCDAIDRMDGVAGDLELCMYGSGDQEAEIIGRLAASLGAAFRFKGVAGEAEKARAYAWADVVVMPSLWGEGLPMVLLEAMAAGVVPIATPDGSIPEVLTDNESGIMVATGSPESLANGLVHAIHLNRSGGLRQLAKNAHDTVRQTYSLFQQAQHLDRIYTEISK